MAVLHFNRTISWRMFQPYDSRPADAKENEDAQIAPYLRPQKNVPIVMKGGTFRIKSMEVDIYVERSESWVLKSRMNDRGLLKHEQGHYDIMAIGAREYYNNALKIRAKDPPELMSTLDTLGKEINTRAQAAQDKYDYDSKGGLNSSGQGKWFTSISTTKLHADGKLGDLPQ